MKKPLIYTILLLFFTFSINAQSLTDLEKNRIELPNSWSLTPIGTSLNLGDLPLNMAVSASKKYIAVTNNGQSKQSIQIIDVSKKKIVFEKPIGKAWVGLKFSHKDKYLFASGGNDNCILRYRFQKDSIALMDSFILGAKWPN